MKVALTEHVDRSEEKNLLRGCTGYVHSWIWHANEPRPEVVYLKFADATWQLDGIEEPGIYPILPKTKTWFLDKGRKVSVLGIKRTQLPLAPGYAMTAHSSQGKTLPAVLLDLDVDKQVDPTFGTVAATRVRSREDVLSRSFREVQQMARSSCSTNCAGTGSTARCTGHPDGPAPRAGSARRSRRWTSFHMNSGSCTGSTKQACAWHARKTMRRPNAANWKGWSAWNAWAAWWRRSMQRFHEPRSTSRMQNPRGAAWNACDKSGMRWCAADAGCGRTGLYTGVM